MTCKGNGIHDPHMSKSTLLEFLPWEFYIRYHLYFECEKEHQWLLLMVAAIEGQNIDVTRWLIQNIWIIWKLGDINEAKTNINIGMIVIFIA